MSDKSSVPSATNLPASPKGDQSIRMRNYTISMTIRTLCFVLAIFTHGWIRWVFAIAAILLPYIAVVLANASNQRRIDVRGSVRPQRADQQLPSSHS